MTNTPHRLTGVTGPAAPAWKRELTMGGAERRVLHVRGAARDQTCARCPERALHWVWARKSENTRSTGSTRLDRWWSLDPQDYDPMCRAHRNQFDHNILHLEDHLLP